MATSNPFLTFFVSAYVLAGTACGGAAARSEDEEPPTGRSSDVDAAVICQGETVTLVDFEIVPEHLDVAAGEASFCVRNEGEAPHDFTVRAASGHVLGQTSDLSPGSETVLVLELPAGDHVTLCSLPGHESLGMVGSVTAR